MSHGVLQWWPGVALLVIALVVAVIAWHGARGNLPHHARRSRLGGSHREL